MPDLTGNPAWNPPGLLPAPTISARAGFWRDERELYVCRTVGPSRGTRI